MENVTVSHGRKAVLKCEVENLRNYKVGTHQFQAVHQVRVESKPLELQRGRMFQCPREERLSSSAWMSTSGITEGECVSVLRKKGCPQVPERVPVELQRENVPVS